MTVSEARHVITIALTLLYNTRDKSNIFAVNKTWLLRLYKKIQGGN